MKQENKHFVYFATDFGRVCSPKENGRLAGYAAIIQHYSLCCPLPDILSVIGEKHKTYTDGIWRFFTPRHAPYYSLYGHLIFALKNEGVELGVLKSLFEILPEQEIVNIIQQEPTGSYSRRLWFLYEWLQEKSLPLSDVTQGNFVDVLDSKIQYPALPRPSRRHRVRNNLSGVRNFCPLIRRTEKLDALIALNLSEKAKQNIGHIHSDVLLRAAAFLLLKDSKASYVIEGENPPYSRIERWGSIIGQAGTNLLSGDELLRLQRIVISDTRFTKLGYRTDGGFVGSHDRKSGMPIPDHISARHEDLHLLIDALLQTHILLQKSDYPAVLIATIVAFGFVFIHPFEDGNGRIHRYLIHHVLAEKEFAPKGVIFPVSAVILEKIHKYREILEAYSRARLEFIQWRPTEKGNVEVLNDTINLYRYFDATKQAEFLYSCVQETIEHTLPEEVDYLQKHDLISNFIKNYVDMPDRMVDLLVRFLNQHNGTLSERARNKEFEELTDKEISAIEEKYQDIFAIC